MKNRIFVTITKLDKDYLDFIDTNFRNTKNDFVSLFELRNKGLRIILKSFISYRKYDEVIFVFNDELYKLVESLFYALSLLILKIKILKILPTKKYEKITLLKRVCSILKMSVSTIETRQLLKRTRKETVLMARNKVNSIISQNSKLFYIKTNIGFGGNVGGSLGHISGVVNALDKKSHTTFITAQKPVMIRENVKKKFIDLEGITYTVPFELNRLKINKVLIKQINSLIQENRPDIIYQRLTLYDYCGAYLSNKYKIPLIVEYNGSEAWVQNNWGSGLKYSDVALLMESYVLSSADTIITVSKVLQNELIERGFKKEKIVFYPNCIDQNIFDYKKFEEEDKTNLRSKLGFKKEDKVFTFIGTFGAWHGVEFLAKSIVKLVNNYKNILDKHNVKFLIIGDGLLGEKVRRILGVDRIRDYVTFTGIIPQKEAPRYLSISDCFLSPHIKQKEKFIGSPTKLFEYMSFAKPIIASNLDQVGEIFDSKLFAKNLNSLKNISTESAIVFEPDNYHEFLKAILFVATRNDLDKLGKNAYDMVMKKYTWDIHVEKIINKYNEVNSVKQNN